MAHPLASKLIHKKRKCSDFLMSVQPAQNSPTSECELTYYHPYFNGGSLHAEYYYTYPVFSTSKDMPKIKLFFPTSKTKNANLPLFSVSPNPKLETSEEIMKAHSSFLRKFTQTGRTSSLSNFTNSGFGLGLTFDMEDENLSDSSFHSSTFQNGGSFQASLSSPPISSSTMISRPRRFRIEGEYRENSNLDASSLHDSNDMDVEPSPQTNFISSRSSSFSNLAGLSSSSHEPDVGYAQVIEAALRAYGGAATGAEITQFIQENFPEFVKTKTNHSWRHSVIACLATNKSGLFEKDPTKATSKKNTWRLVGYDPTTQPSPLLRDTHPPIPKDVSAASPAISTPASNNSNLLLQTPIRSASSDLVVTEERFAPSPANKLTENKEKKKSAHSNESEPHPVQESSNEDDEEDDDEEEDDEEEEGSASENDLESAKKKKKKKKTWGRAKNHVNDERNTKLLEYISDSIEALGGMASAADITDHIAATQSLEELQIESKKKLIYTVSSLLSSKRSSTRFEKHPIARRSSGSGSKPRTLWKNIKHK